MLNKGFASLHPVPCFFYYIGLIILATIVYHPVFLFFAICSQIVLNFMQDGGKNLKKSIRYYLLIALFIVVLNPLISHRGETILFYFLDNPVTLEAFVYGIIMMMSFLTILIGFVSYNMVITPNKFLYLFSSTFPKTALACMMTMRFVPVLIRRSKDLALVQKTRGVDVSGRHLIKKITAGMQVLNTLVIWSLEEAIVTCKSMRARGYGVFKSRTSSFDYKMRARDWLVLVILVSTFGSRLYFWYKGIWHFTIYPVISKISFDVNTALFFATFCTYLGIPIAVEGAEKLKWR